MPSGLHGIAEVSPDAPTAIVCGECGRAWLEDITPTGRCPWEYEHAEEED